MRRGTLEELHAKPIVAACALLQNTAGEILLIYNFRRGIGLPGGIIDSGESPLEAALRELKEETGYEAVAYENAPLYDGITDSGKRAQTFLVTAWRGELRSSHEGEVKWDRPSLLINAGAAYPIYNGYVLKVFEARG